MLQILIPALAFVLVPVLGVLGQWLASRNDAAQALREMDLVEKLESADPAALQLREVVRTRIDRWHKRAMTPPWWIRLGRYNALALVANALAVIGMYIAVGYMFGFLDVRWRR